MNDTNNDGGSAFPIPYGQVMSGAGMGMSLRDYFAARALSGLVFHNDWGARSDQEMAEGAYSIADAMIAERLKRK